MPNQWINGIEFKLIIKKNIYIINFQSIYALDTFEDISSNLILFLSILVFQDNV